MGAGAVRWGGRDGWGELDPQLPPRCGLGSRFVPWCFVEGATVLGGKEAGSPGEALGIAEGAKPCGVFVIAVRKRNCAEACADKGCSALMLQGNQQMISPFACKVIRLGRPINLGFGSVRSGSWCALFVFSVVLTVSVLS